MKNVLLYNNSFESNPVHGFGVRDFLRVQKGSKFSFYRVGPGFGPFLAKQVRTLGFLEGF